MIVAHCKVGWQSNGMTCMKAFRGALTQSQAKDACRREGGSLAVLDSRTVNEGAKNLLKRGKPAKPHIIIIIIYVLS